jgi:hypothetical protein
MWLSGQIGVISALVSVRNLIHGVTVINKLILCGLWSSCSVFDANSSLMVYLYVVYCLHFQDQTVKQDWYTAGPSKYP